MSSSRPGRRPRSLRAKLIAQQLVVVAVVCVLIGLVTEFALHSFLIGQVDNQLGGASRRAGPPPDGRPPGGGGGPGDGPPPDLLGAGQGSGTLAAVIHPDGSIDHAEWLTQDGGRSSISREGQRQLIGLPRDGGKYTLDIS